jgi:flagellar assembly protein FliH
MSSRVLRLGDLRKPPDPADAHAGAARQEAIEPIVWRRAGGAPPHEPKQAGNPPGAQNTASADQNAEHERQMEARVAAARAQGRSEGESAARQSALDRLHPVIASFQALVGDLSGQGHRLRTEAERDTVKLAVAIARRILHREITVDPEAVLGLVKAAFSKVEARETHRLRVSIADAALLKEYRERLNLPAAIEIVADASLQDGSAIFETSRGELDASIDTQLGEIDRGLADVVRRRLK